MWVKLILLTLYLLLLFFLSRLLEAASWYHGKSFLSSSNLVDPFALSVKKLKQLLDSRGVSYTGVVEKQELVSLVAASGDPVEEELSDASKDDDDAANSGSKYQSTHFTCGYHFYEEVEDTKDSVWLVQVVASNSYHPLLDDATWKQVIIKVASFGVRTGIFNCVLDERLCARKGWTTSRLIMALPRSNKAKEDVVMYDYLYPSKVPSVLQWVRRKLSSRVKITSSLQDLNDDWATQAVMSDESTVKVILFSSLTEPPLFLSSLAIKFTGRVKFGMVNVLPRDEYYKAYLNDSKLPVYLVITPERTFRYGTKPGECFNFKCMESFLKSFQPEMNDVFLWSLLLINVLAGLQLFLISGQFWKHFVIYIMCFVKYNCVLFLFWLLVLTLYQFPFMTTFTNMCLKCLRIVSGTDLAAMCRSDWKNFYSYPFLFLTFILFGTLVGLALRQWGAVLIDDELSFFSNWWSDPSDSYIMTYFFQPMATLTRPVASQDFDLEEGIELWIERLAVPNLWLQPVISSDYIKDLPVWKYQGWCKADDAAEENKLDLLSSSDDENTNISENSDSTVNNFASELPEHQQNKYFEICKRYQQEGLSDSTVKSSQEKIHLSSHDKKESNRIVCSKCSCSATNNGIRIPCTTDCTKSYERKCTKECSESLLTNLRSSNPTTKKEHETPETLRAPQGMLVFRECSICLENYQYGELLCGLPCGHNYHMNCITLWLFRDNHCCPVCRWPSYKVKNSTTHLHLQ